MNASDSRLVVEALGHYTDAVVAVERVEDETSERYQLQREAMSASYAALLAVIDAYALQRSGLRLIV